MSAGVAVAVWLSFAGWVLTALSLAFWSEAHRDILGPWAIVLWPLWAPFWLLVNSGRPVVAAARAVRALGWELPALLDLIRGRKPRRVAKGEG